MGIWGAYKNVLINLGGIKDEAFVKQMTEKATVIKDRAVKNMNKVLDILDKRI